MDTEKLTIAAFRRERGETLEQFAEMLGLSSRGHASEIEQGKKACSFEVALTLESLSGGRLDAAELNEQIRRARDTANAA